MKKCISCENVKPFTDFYKDRRRKDNHGIYCKSCWNLKYASTDEHLTARRLAVKKHWDKKSTDPEFKQQRRRNQLKYLYKLSIEDYDNLLQKQNGKCSICLSEFSSTNVPRVDHDHACCAGHRSCGRCVRGLLCKGCNHLLGQSRDSEETLTQAINYLRRWSQSTKHKDS